MGQAPTIVDLIIQRASHPAPDTGFHFLTGSGDSTEHLSYPQLADKVARAASGLVAAGFKRKDRIVLMIPERKDFVLTFYGCVWAGMVPVPVAPPTSLRALDSYATRMRPLIEAAAARGVITTPALRAVGPTIADASRLFVTTESVLSTEFGQSVASPVGREETALIQFTSGSVRAPRGVPLTTENLAVNSQIHIYPSVQNGPRESDVCVTWLPFFHDAGLLASLTGTLAFGGRGVFIPPLLFLKRPAVWLQEVTKHRGTVVLAPNFAYALCTKRVTEEEIDHLDLRSWTRVMCAAETIRMDTLREFTKRFERAGFRWSSWLPGYGLAEHVVATTFDQRERRPRFDCVDRTTVVEHGIAEPTDNADALHIACCGQAFAGHEVRTVDEYGRPCDDRKIGEIQVRGPSLMSAYLDHTPEQSGITEDGWFHTGDLGYMVGQDLFVTGRMKELVIIGGRNYYPTDIEDVMSRIDGVRAGNVVAFGIPSPNGSEELVICAEARDASRAKEIALEAKGSVAEALGIEVSDIRILRPGSLPKTSSGKLRRQECRTAYLDGRLGSKPKFALVKSLKLLATARWRLLTSEKTRTL